MQSDILEKVLEHARNSELPEGMNYDETLQKLLAETEDRASESAERALLALYYFTGITPPGDAENQKSLYKILDELCSNYKIEKDDKLRGRKIWITLNKLIEKDNIDEIRDMLVSLNETEKSPFVWERVLAVCSNRENTYKLYPEILMQITALEEYVPERWNQIINTEQEYILSCLKVSSNIQNRTASWMENLINGKIDYTPIFSAAQAMAASGTLLPLTIEQITDLFDRAEGKAELRLLFFFSHYIQSLDNRARDDLFHNLENEDEKIAEDNIKTAKNLATTLLRILSDRFSSTQSVYRQSYVVMLKLIAGKEEALRECIELLCSIDPSTHQPGFANDLWKKLSPHILKLITQKVVPEQDILRAVELLGSANEYFRQLGATILLHAHRCKYDISSVIDKIEEQFNANPETKNALNEGKDIEGGELDFTFNFPSYDLFGQKEETAEDDDGFMNLGNLTGMLEACQPPVTAFRLKLLLEAYKMKTEITKQTEPDAKPEAEHQYQAAPHVLGPMTLDEVIDIFNRLAVDNADTANIIKQKEKEIAELRLEKLTIGQRKQVKAVFEGTEAEGLTNYTITHKLISNDGFKWPQFSGYGPEGSCDYLALYLIREGLREDKDFYSGVYFNAAQMLDYIKYIDIPTEDLTMTVAVHELYHAFCEDMMRKSHNHAGESPEYCRLEEAGANRAAFEWALSNLSEDTNKTLSETLLATLEDSPRALPGYGEYKLLDAQAGGWIPLMLEEASHAQPEDYRNKKSILNAASSKNQRNYETNSLIWRGMVEEIKTNESVCWFIDFR